MSGRSRGRTATVIVLGGLAVTAAVGQHVRPAPAATAPGPDTVPTSTTMSAAWYCVAGSGGAPATPDETIVIANAAPRSVRALITVMPGAPNKSVSRAITVPARARLETRVAEVLGGSNGGVVVETFGGDVAVEHVLESGKDFAAAPCARTAGDHWYFAVGSTARDAKEVLAIFNPFADDAVVDIAFATDDGVKRPPALRGKVVPARTRITVAPSDHLPRQDHVAAIVTARHGRVVAERTMTFDGTNGRGGLALTAGARAQPAHLVFAEGIVNDGVNETFVLFNPADTDAAVSIRVRLDNGQILEPDDVAVAGRAVSTVDLTPKLPKGVGHAVEVVVTEGTVAVEQFGTSRAPAPRTGVEVTTGASEAATGWLFAAGRADTVRDEWVILYNPAAHAVSAHVFVLAGGQLLTPERLDAVTVPARGRAAFRLGDSLQRPDTPVFLTVTGPVYAERGIFGDGYALGYGLPLRVPASRPRR